MTSPLFSAWGKLRLLMEWLRSSGVRTTRSSSSVADESLADFARRRFGREALDRLIQPLVGGIYTADPERLSLAATMPRFLQMEREYGSLIRQALFPEVCLDGRYWAPRSRRKMAETILSSGARYGLFAGLKGGMEDLPNSNWRLATTSGIELLCTVADICDGN